MLGALGEAQAAGAQELVPGVTGFGQRAFQTAQEQLGAAAGFDPLAAAEERFGRLQAVLGQQRERQRGSLESRLLAQGRLSGTSGDILQGELERGFAAEDAALLERAFGESEQAQARAIQQGLQAGAAGTTAQQSQFQQFLQGVPVAEQAGLAPVRLAGALSGLATDEVNRRAAAAGALGAHNVSMQQTAQAGLGGTIGGIVGGVGGAVAAPYLGLDPKTGAQAGATLGGNLGSFL
jgi:hypothetical protein